MDRMRVQHVPRVLAVDGEAAALDMIVSALSRLGYQVLAAHTGQEALAYLADGDFDVVVTDVKTALQTQPSLLGELRRYPPQTVGLVLTGAATEISIADVVREGAHDYIAKPFEADILRAIITRTVERVSLARAMCDLAQELVEDNGQLRSFADQLQRRIDEATRELRAKVQELDRANRQLEEARRQREELIAMIAHDLGSPLTAIAGYAQMLLRTKHQPETHERACQTIVGEARRMARLVGDLADISRMSSGQFKVETSPVDVAALCHEQVELARARTDRHRIDYEGPDDMVVAPCDRDRMAQVLSNLLSNAIKYTPGGTIRVQLRTEEHQVVINVADEGPGIPRDSLDRIFEPHVRLERKRAGGRAEGSGLGLAIAKAIVKAHGGRIWGESVVGHGTTFTVALPCGSLAGKQRPAVPPASRVA